MKRFLITCFLITISLSGFGQEEKFIKERKTTFGVTVGLNSIFYKVDGNINHNPTNLYGGFFLETSLNKRFSFKGEILYSRIQSEDFNMFEVPLMFKYRISKRLSVFAGFQLNYLYNGRENPDFARKIDKPLTLGINVGIEYELTEKLFINLRYTHRFTNQIHLGLTNIKGFRIGIGYRF